MKLLKWLLIFLVLNFGALYIGNILMDNGPQTQWYQNLNQAPWTPPGWLFGVAWTTIMLCFSVYMSYLVITLGFNKIATVFSVQILLNIIWNYIFFNLHQTAFGLLIITLLTSVVFYFFFKYYITLKAKSFLILPYMIWLLIATSLNLYIVIYN
ncbi:MAG: tryptophan-rich sensory protein [Flavobacteriaceae bacterium]|nr:tryptophan-rich sensory protein [Flavobacteriaceae bacterium]